jgi:hypothetical protein
MKTSKRKFTEQRPGVPTVHTPRLPPVQERIGQRAHEIYQARGGTTGRELDDWLQAEREIKAGENPSPKV